MVMKKIIALPVFLFSFSLAAQIGLLHPGMKINEFHKNFPSAVPDLSAMTQTVSGADTLAGQIGQESDMLVHDTLKQFYFQSALVSGPSNDFPKADSLQYSKMMRSVREMYYHYCDMFGAPNEVKQHSPIVPKKLTVDPNVFYAHWILPEGEVKVTVSPRSQ